MKIRTDFVTNSSSSSFVCYRFDPSSLYKFLKKEGYLSLVEKLEKLAAGEKWESSNIVFEKYSDNELQVSENEVGLELSYCIAYACGISNHDKLENFTEMIDDEVTFESDKTDFIEKRTEGGSECDTIADFCKDFRTSGYKHEYANGKLVCYAAYPYVGGFNFNNSYDYFIDLNHGYLELRDAKGNGFGDIIWNNESVFYTLNQIDSYTILNFEFCNVTSLTIPNNCKRIFSGSFEHCSQLESITILGIATKFQVDSIPESVIIYGFPGSTSEKYAKENGNKFIPLSRRELENLGLDSMYEDIIYTVNDNIVSSVPQINCDCDTIETYSRFLISNDVKKIKSGAFTTGKWMLFCNTNVKLEKNAISKEIDIYAYPNNNIQKYAKENGNKFIPLSRKALENLELGSMYEDTIYTVNDNIVSSVPQINCDCDTIKTYSRFLISNDVKKIKSGAFTAGTWVLFCKADADIEENAISREINIYAYPNGNIQKYAKENGNKFISLQYDKNKPIGLPFNICEGEICIRKKVALSIQGIIPKQLLGIPHNTAIEIVRERNGLNTMCVAFKIANSDRFIGVMKHTVSLVVAYLMDQGYVEFENAFINHKKIYADLIWSQPYSSNYEEYFYIKELFRNDNCTNKIIEFILDKYLIEDSILKIAEYHDDTEMIEKKLLEKLNEPDNNLSHVFFGELSNKNITVLKYYGYNIYEMCNCLGRLIVSQNKIVCTDEKHILTGKEKKFVLAYINHYRRIYNLPEIMLNAEKED